MPHILFWLLPIVDVFTIKRIQRYYRSLGVRIPWSHAKTGLVERWVGYMPLGFIIGWFAGFWTALAAVLVVLATIGPIELYVMYRGFRPWRFFRHKPFRLVGKIFLLEGYNASGYYLFGALLAAITRILFP